MNTTKTTYTVEITTDEIKILSDALHEQFKTTKNEIDNIIDFMTENPDEISSETIRKKEDLIHKRDNLRQLRNGFANLINRFYVGADA